MEMFREIPSSSEARQVLSEEEMNRLLQKERDRMDGVYFEGMTFGDYLEMMDMVNRNRSDEMPRTRQKAREPIKIYAEGGISSTIYGDSGDDILVGGDGKDAISGGEDNDDITGNAGDDGYLNAARFQTSISTQNNEEAFRYYYAMKANDPYNFGIPRQIRLGVKLDF